MHVERCACALALLLDECLSSRLIALPGAMLEELDLRGERLQYKRLGAELVAECAFLLDTSYFVT